MKVKLSVQNLGGKKMARAKPIILYITPNEERGRVILKLLQANDLDFDLVDVNRYKGRPEFPIPALLTVEGWKFDLEVIERFVYSPWTQKHYKKPQHPNSDQPDFF